MKYYIIAGEASGDLHGSNLIKALKQADNTAEFRVWGGDLMQSEVGEVVKHIRDLAFMGFVEVVKNLRTILGFMDLCKKDIEVYQPDVLILIDYPGFNLRISEWAKAKGIRNFFYISPQIWAWNTKRVHKIKKTVDRMYVILPFEKAFYKKYDCEVDFVGHPLLDVIENRVVSPTFRQEFGLSDKPIIALLPGSRRQEITTMLGILLTIVPNFPTYQFAIAGAPSLPSSFYDSVIRQFNEKRLLTNQPLISGIKVVPNRTYDLLQSSEAALVTSGTATLETALFDVPLVICYKGNPISYQIAKRIVDIEYIGLANLIMDRPMIQELIQGELTTENITIALNKIATGTGRATMLANFEDLKAKLGGKGASKRTAELMVERLRT